MSCHGANVPADSVESRVAALRFHGRSEGDLCDCRREYVKLSKRVRDVSLPGNMRLLSISQAIAAWRPKGVAEVHEGACRDADDVVGVGSDPVSVGFLCFLAGGMLVAVAHRLRSSGPIFPWAVWGSREVHRIALRLR